jgi:hypothetical protein
LANKIAISVQAVLEVQRGILKKILNSIMAAKVAATKSSSSDTPPAIRRQRQSSETGLGLGKGRLRNAILNRFRSSTVTGSSSKVTSGEELESRIENANKGSPISNDPSSTGTPNQVSVYKQTILKM